ncbi:MAG: peptidylprolyl isomerase [Candidatus Moraniibacteriota bacterium]
MRKKILVVSGLIIAVLTLSGCSPNDTPTPLQTSTKLTQEDIVKNTSTPPPAPTSVPAPVPTPSNNPSDTTTKPMPSTTPTPAVSFDPKDRSYSNQYSSAVIHTSLGDITVKLLTDVAPMTVNNFLKLADNHFYDGILFHRVIKGFMIQGGDPNSKLADWSQHGTGGPGYKFADELDNKPLMRGALAMANSGPNTNGSQFFILTAPTYSGPYTHFGEVTKGMEIVDAIEGVQTNSNDHPLQNVAITGVDLVKK